jgi:hypothetical protein
MFASQSTLTKYLLSRLMCLLPLWNSTTYPSGRQDLQKEKFGIEKYKGTFSFAIL